MKLLQINTDVNVGSTGKIAEQIGQMALDNWFESWIAYGRDSKRSSSNIIKISNPLDVNIHAFETRLFDNHGLASSFATRKFINRIQDISPNIIHLHNIHGYYLNYPILFDFLKEWGGPVVWTLHDCWPFTGHCAYFMMNGCEKWQKECHDCPNLSSYPASYLYDGSKRNFRLKAKYFTSLGDKLTLVPVSNYVGNYLRDSFFRDTKMQVIHNGIDLDIFKPCAPKEKFILGVANVWEPRKGLQDFFKLRNLLTSDIRIVLVGLSEKQIKNLPDGITGIRRTNGQTELAKLYSSAIALVNPTYEDNYPTVNLEAIACGTPVITYNTGGSPESVTDDTGIIVERGNITGLRDAISKMASSSKYSSNTCRQHAIQNFDQKNCFQIYLNLYNQLLTYKKS